MAKKYRGKLKEIYGGRSSAGRNKLPLSVLQGMTPKQHCESLIAQRRGGRFARVSDSEDVCYLPSCNYFSCNPEGAEYSYYYDVCEEITFSISINGNKVSNTQTNHILKENDRVIIKTNQPVYWSATHNDQYVEKIAKNDLTYSFTFKQGRVLVTATSKCLNTLNNSIGFTSEQHLPCIDLLKQAYPSFGSHPPVLPSQDGYNHQCAVRVSVALQKNGIDIKGRYPKVNQTSEGYARSAKGLADWLWQQYGKPQIMSPDEFARRRKTLKGIFYQHPYDGEIAHIDIIDGLQTGSGDYRAKEIWFWALECK